LKIAYGIGRNDSKKGQLTGLLMAAIAARWSGNSWLAGEWD